MDERLREGFFGTGSGAIAPDGSSVELLSRLPALKEPDIIEREVPVGASILELGSGAGRITHSLLKRGFTVTAVDESAEMLERVRGARTICSKIETLQLDEKFDAVILASGLINYTWNARECQDLLRVCSRHVADRGCVLIHRHLEDQFEYPPEKLPQERGSLGDCRIRLISSELVGPGVRSVTLEYLFPDARFTHTVRTRSISTQDLEQALVIAGLTIDTYLTEQRTWLKSVPIT